MHKDFDKFCAEAVMKWYGWGSPIGLTIFFLGLSICGWIVRKTITGS